jgi:hypothetical protein
MNEYEYERKQKLEAIENFLANLTSETLERIRLDVSSMPESGYHRFMTQAVYEVICIFEKAQS